jgi:hypothetical protein
MQMIKHAMPHQPDCGSGRDQGCRVPPQHPLGCRLVRPPLSGCSAAGIGLVRRSTCISAGHSVPGERLTFILKWTIIPAGEAVLEVLPQEHMAGIDAHHFVLTARSNAFVDAFYMVRDRIDAWADSRHDVSRCLYRKKQHEGRTRRDITVSFDWEDMTVQYTNAGRGPGTDFHF